MQKHMKFLQMTLLIITGSIGMLSGILVGKTTNYFQKNCILYANISIQRTYRRKTDQLDVLVRPGSTWGPEGTCNFITFEGILVFINSFIWFWFYIHMENIIRVDVSNTTLSVQSFGNGGRFGRSRLYYPIKSKDVGNYQSRYAIFVLPPIMLNSLLCLTSIVRAAYISDGYRQFQNNICVYDGRSCLLKSPHFSANELQYANWTLLSAQKPNRPFAFHDAMNAATTLSWLEPMALACHVLVVMADVFLNANPPEAQTDSHSSGAAIQELTWSRGTLDDDDFDNYSLASDDSSLQYWEGVAVDEANSQMMIESMTPDTLPTPPQDLLRRWAMETPNSTPVSRKRRLISRRSSSSKTHFPGASRAGSRRGSLQRSSRVLQEVHASEMAAIIPDLSGSEIDASRTPPWRLEGQLGTSQPSPPAANPQAKVAESSSQESSKTAFTEDGDGKARQSWSWSRHASPYVSLVKKTSVPRVSVEQARKISQQLEAYMSSTAAVKDSKTKVKPKTSKSTSRGRKPRFSKASMNQAQTQDDKKEDTDKSPPKTE